MLRFRCSYALPLLLSAIHIRAVIAEETPESMPPAKRIAVVNVSRVFSAYRKVADIKSSLKTEFEPRRDALAARERKLKDAEVLMAQGHLPKDQRERLKEIHYFKMKKIDFEEDSAAFIEEVESKRMAAMKQVLREIRSAIRSMATLRRIDLVLRAPDREDDGRDRSMGDADGPETSRVPTAAEMAQKYQRNAIHFYVPKIDLTIDVIRKLNDAYYLARKTSREKAQSLPLKGKQKDGGRGASDSE